MTKADLTNSIAALPGSSTNSLHDIKPPVVIPNGWTWAAWAGAALLAAALACWAWRYWRKKKLETAAVPAIPAHVRARQRLAEALSLIGQPKEFCIAVSDTVRWYLEERFEFHAPERTTEEFLGELRQTDLLTPDQKDSLVEFLNQCDLAKFARYEPGEAELRALHASALRLVEETEPEPASENSVADSRPSAVTHLTNQ
jgi:hypothetical protein